MQSTRSARNAAESRLRDVLGMGWALWGSLAGIGLVWRSTWLSVNRASARPRSGKAPKGLLRLVDNGPAATWVGLAGDGAAADVKHGAKSATFTTSAMTGRDADCSVVVKVWDVGLSSHLVLQINVFRAAKNKRL